jgi:hypothetical protein
MVKKARHTVKVSAYLPLTPNFFCGHNSDTFTLYHANRRPIMDFLQAHWHCIVPVLGIAAFLLLTGRREKEDG